MIQGDALLHPDLNTERLVYVKAAAQSDTGPLRARFGPPDNYLNH